MCTCIWLTLLYISAFVGTVKNSCTPDICQNGGECVSRAAESVCVCPEGFTGEICGESLNETDLQKNQYETIWIEDEGIRWDIILAYIFGFGPLIFIVCVVIFAAWKVKHDEEAFLKWIIKEPPITTLLMPPDASSNGKSGVTYPRLKGARVSPLAGDIEQYCERYRPDSCSSNQDENLDASRSTSNQGGNLESPPPKFLFEKKGKVSPLSGGNSEDSVSIDRLSSCLPPVDSVSVSEVPGSSRSQSLEAQNFQSDASNANHGSKTPHTDLLGGQSSPRCSYNLNTQTNTQNTQYIGHSASPYLPFGNIDNQPTIVNVASTPQIPTNWSIEFQSVNSEVPSLPSDSGKHHSLMGSRTELHGPTNTQEILVQGRPEADVGNEADVSESDDDFVHDWSKKYWVPHSVNSNDERNFRNTDYAFH